MKLIQKQSNKIGMIHLRSREIAESSCTHNSTELSIIIDYDNGLWNALLVGLFDKCISF